jgi:hypothetical protein
MSKPRTRDSPKPERGRSDAYDTSKAEGSKAEGSKTEGSKTEGSKTADAASSGYSRGEGQKPVTKAYKDNWNAIFAKKRKR